MGALEFISESLEFVGEKGVKADVKVGVNTDTLIKVSAALLGVVTMGTLLFFVIKKSLK